MPYDEHLKQDIGKEFIEDSRPVIDVSQHLTKSAIQSLVATNNQIRSELTRFNGDVDKAYNFYNKLYSSQKSKLSSYTSKIADCNYKIIQDKNLLNVTKNPLARQKITERINYNSGLVTKYSSKIDVLKKNCKNYKSILGGLDSIRKSSVKKKLLDSTKKALLKSAKVGKEVAKTTAKATIEGVESGVSAGIDASTDSVAAGVSATGVGAPVGAGIKAGRLAGKATYKTVSTTTKGLVHAADKTAMSASNAMKESIKLAKIQTLLTGYDDPKEMVKTVGQKGLNLVTTTVFTAFNFALKELIKFMVSPVLYLIGVAILAYLIFFGLAIYSSISGITTVIEATQEEEKKTVSNKNMTGYGNSMASAYIFLLDIFDGNDVAVSGIMGNIYEETGGTFSGSILEYGFSEHWGVTGAEYAAGIDSGSYVGAPYFTSGGGSSEDIRYKFSHDFCGTYSGNAYHYDDSRGSSDKGAGFGFCQFTYYNKKEDLYDLAKSDNWNCSVGNLTLQLYYAFGTNESTTIEELGKECDAANQEMRDALARCTDYEDLATAVGIMGCYEAHGGYSDSIYAKYGNDVYHYENRLTAAKSIYEQCANGKVYELASGSGFSAHCDDIYSNYMLTGEDYPYSQSSYSTLTYNDNEYSWRHDCSGTVSVFLMTYGELTSPHSTVDMHTPIYSTFEVWTVGSDITDASQLLPGDILVQPNDINGVAAHTQVITSVLVDSDTGIVSVGGYSFGSGTVSTMPYSNKTATVEGSYLRLGGSQKYYGYIIRSPQAIDESETEEE